MKARRHVRNPTTQHALWRRSPGLFCAESVRLPSLVPAPACDPSMTTWSSHSRPPTSTLYGLSDGSAALPAWRSACQHLECPQRAAWWSSARSLQVPRVRSASSTACALGLDDGTLKSLRTTCCAPTSKTYRWVVPDHQCHHYREDCDMGATR